MKPKTSLLMGAAAAVTAGPGLAATVAPAEPAVPAAASYADLLQPIPNAVERLKIADLQQDQAAPARLIEAQYYQYHHHHHHHHHDRRWYLSHGYVWWNGVWIIRPVWWANRRHHHHHHHNAYPYGYSNDYPPPPRPY